MTDSLDMVFLARLQFAFTVSFHSIFPAFTIGLASYLAMLEGLWLKTGRDVYLQLYRFWVKIFAISFGMGVVSGLVMSYQFGTNWSLFSELTGNVLSTSNATNSRHTVYLDRTRSGRPMSSFMWWIFLIPTTRNR